MNKNAVQLPGLGRESPVTGLPVAMSMIRETSASREVSPAAGGTAAAVRLVPRAEEEGLPPPLLLLPPGAVVEPDAVAPASTEPPMPVAE